MINHYHIPGLALLLAILCILLGRLPVIAQTDEPTPLEKQEQLAADRYLEVLKKRPRAGTAFDKVYGFHIGQGSLEQFAESLRREAQQASNGQAAMLWGLVQMQRGIDADARLAFELAERLLPEEPLASFYLGKSLVAVGEVDLAVQAFERAIERRPAKADMLQIFQELGRVYQRTRRAAQALAVWQRMEELFPGDLQVQEQIASILETEGALNEALIRYERLAEQTSDRFRKVELAVHAAAIRLQLGQTQPAVAALERLLSGVNPSSWLFNDIRRRIDEAYLSRNDSQGLTRYYERWCEQHPDDIDAMLRIGRVLSMAKRTAEAKEWFQRAIARAPSQSAPRLALVEALERDGEYGEAASALATLLELESENADLLVKLGQLHISNRKLSVEDRHTKAATVWRQLLKKNSDDPVALARVADLLRSAEQTDEAISLYRKAISLADSEPQYREYLGEFLFRLGRTDEALAVWREIASGPRESRDNLIRLSEVLFAFKADTEGLAVLAKACDRKPLLSHRLRYVEKLREAGEHARSLEQLELAGAMAESEDDRLLVLQQEIECHQATGELASRISQLADELAADHSKTEDKWQRLAFFQEADSQNYEAAQSAAEAINLNPSSITSLVLAARANEKAGLFSGAMAAYQKLAQIDRRFRLNHLTQIATIQLRQGQTEAAMKTASDMLASGTAGAEQVRFYADLCFQSGQIEQGLSALRRHVRNNPRDRQGIGLLARNLDSQFRTEEAIEQYWRSYEVASSLDERKSDIQALTNLYLRTNHFDQLITRIEAQSRENNQARDAAILGAVAHQQVGDFASARRSLESLLRDNARDEEALRMLVSLSQNEGDWDAAIAGQIRLNEVVPGREGQLQLRKFYLAIGDVDAAESVWQMSGEEQSIEHLQMTIDNLFEHGDTDRLLALVNQVLSKADDNWEELTVCALTLCRVREYEQAKKVAERIVDLQLSPESLSEFGRSIQSKQAQINISAAPPVVRDSFGRQSTILRTREVLQTLVSPSQPAINSAKLKPQFQAYSYADAHMLCSAIALLSEVEFDVKHDKVMKIYTDLESKTPDQLWQALLISQLGRQAVSAPGALVPTRQCSILKQLIDQGDHEAEDLLADTYLAQLRSRWSGNADKQKVPVDPIYLNEIAQSIEKHTADQIHPNRRANTAILFLLLAKEYELLNDRETVARLVARGKELARLNPDISVATQMVELEADQAIEIYKQFIQSRYLSRMQALPANTIPVDSVPFLASLVTTPGVDDKLVGLMSELMSMQATYAAKLRPGLLGTYDPTPAKAGSFTFVNHGVVHQLQQTFPANSAFQSRELLLLMRLVVDSGQAKLIEAVDRELKRAAEQPDQSIYQDVVDRLCYATWLWWQDAREPAIAQLDIIRRSGDFDVVAMIESRMLYEMKLIDKAIEVLETQKPVNQQQMQEKELALLQLALQKGDRDKARRLAEKLFALRLPTEAQLKIGKLMYQLGMQDLGDAMLQRLKQRGGQDIGSQAALMQEMLSAGNTDSAAEIARQILRRTRVISTTSSPSSAGFLTSANGENQFRRQALRVLQATDQLQQLITEQEARLAANPKSERVIQALAELYLASGDSQRHEEMLQKSAANQLAASANLSPLARARQFSSAQKYRESVDEYLLVLAEGTTLPPSDYSDFVRSIQRSNSWRRVIHVLDTWNEKQLQSFSASLSPAVLDQCLRASTEDAGRVLLKSLLAHGRAEFVFQAIAQSVEPLKFSRVLDDELRQILVDKMLEEIPKASFDDLYDRVIVYDTGRPLGIVFLIEHLVKDNEALAKHMLAGVQPLAQTRPNARVIEALLLARLHRFEDAKAALESLVERPKQRLTDGVSHRHLWELCAYLEDTAGQKELAIEFLQLLSQESSVIANMREYEDSLHWRLVRSLMEAKRAVEAKTALDHWLIRRPFPKTIHSQGREESAHAQSCIAVAADYEKLGAMLDALLLIDKVLDQTELLRIGNQHLGPSFGLQIRKRREELSRLIGAQGVADLLVLLANEEADHPWNTHTELRHKVPVYLDQLWRSHDLSDARDSTRTGSLMDELLNKIRQHPASLKLVAERLSDGIDSKSASSLALFVRIQLADLVDNDDLLLADAQELLSRLNKPDSAKSTRLNQQRFHAWPLVMPLGRRGHKELALDIVKASVTENIGDSLLNSEEHVRFAQMYRQLEEPDLARAALRRALDQLFPANSEITAAAQGDRR